MVNIKKNLKVAQDWKKIYDDKKRTHIEFKVGENLFLKVKSKRSLLKLGSSPMLATIYCGPFKVLENKD